MKRFDSDDHNKRTLQTPTKPANLIKSRHEDNSQNMIKNHRDMTHSENKATVNMNPFLRKLD